MSKTQVREKLRFNERTARQLKGAEATCVEIATETKKNALDGKTCSMSMFSEIFSPYKHVLAALSRK